MLRRIVFLLLGVALGMTLSLAAVAEKPTTPGAAPRIAAVEPPAMDDKPLLLGDCVAVGEVRFSNGKTLVRFTCRESGATVFVPRETVEVEPEYHAPLGKDEREL